MRYSAMDGTHVWGYLFPRDTAHYDESTTDVMKHLAGEVIEATVEYAALEKMDIDADESNAQWVAMELLDVIHVAESALHRLEDDYGVDMDRAYRNVIKKNRRRGYYDCYR